MGFPSMQEDIQKRKDDGLAGLPISVGWMRAQEGYVRCKHCHALFLEELVEKHSESCRLKQAEQRRAEELYQASINIPKKRKGSGRASQKPVKITAMSAPKVDTQKRPKSVFKPLSLNMPREQISRKRLRKLSIEAYNAISMKNKPVLLSSLYQSITVIHPGFHPHKYGFSTFISLIQAVANSHFKILYIVSQQGLRQTYVELVRQ